MYKHALVLIAGPWLLLTPAVAEEAKEMESSTAEDADRRIPGREAGQEISDRTPEKETEAPLSQTTTVDGETSTRTPQE